MNIPKMTTYNQKRQIIQEGVIGVRGVKWYILLFQFFILYPKCYNYE